MFSVAGIFISLFVLIYLAYRGWSVILIAPIMALAAVLMSGEVQLLATYTEIFMKHMAGFVKNFFPLFLLGAVFGAMMSACGFAEAIAKQMSQIFGAKRAIASVMFACAVLTYGGVSIFVVAFAVFPIAYSLFQQADIPRRLIPGTIALGSFTFTMTTLPGTPQIQNSIPMPYFGTTLYAAPILGLISSVVMVVLGLGWLGYRGRTLKGKGEKFTAVVNKLLTEKQNTGPQIAVWKPWIPIAIVIVMTLFFSKFYFPAQNWDFLKSEPYSTSAEKVVGTWSLIASLSLAIFSIFALCWGMRGQFIQTVNDGVQGALLAVINTASEVGYGNVIAGLASFAVVKTWVLGVSSNPLISASLSTTFLAGITGSASGGLSITLGSLGKELLMMAQQQGISPEALHRVTTIACGGLDSLPHNGAVITLLTICGLTHKESYADVGMVTVVIPLITLTVAIALASVGVV